MRVFLVVGLCFGIAVNGSRAAPLPKVASSGGIFVLDDCDPDFKGKEANADNLSHYDTAGKLLFRITGFNNCESIGLQHRVVVDRERGCVWVCENVGEQLRKYSRGGKLLLAIKGLKVASAAVDPATGNVWVLTSQG